jgi:hypothetical protein
MSQNTITKKGLNTFLHNHEELPKGITSKWCWKKYFFTTYKLPNKIMLMSEKQLAKTVERTRTDVKTFFQQYRLEAILISIPNGQIVESYTLLSVAFYLRRLLKEGSLNYHRFDLNYQQWEDLIFNLSIQQIKKTAVPNPCFFRSSFCLTTAKPINIQFDNGIQLEILILSSGEYRISFEAGMGCIGSSSNLLTDNSLKRGQLFSRLKLSREVIECQVVTKQGVKFVYTLRCSDWLALWEYFAYQKNRKAIYLLGACAQENIVVRVAKALENGN